MNRYSPWLGWLLLAPSLIVLGTFIVYPAIYSLYLSFHNVHPFTGESTFIGLSHYRELFTSDEYWRSLRVSIFFVFLTVPPAIVISLVIAVLLDAQPYCRGFFRTIFLLPVGVSAAMAAMLWVFIFNPSAGYLNFVLSSVGIRGPNWLGDPNWALVAVSIATVWKEIGFNVIFFLAGLASVPDDVREAAIVDGAGVWRRFWYVILPMISPTFFFVTVISVIHSFESFGQIHILTRGGPADATNILVYKLYRDGFEYFRAGFASSQAVILFCIILLLTMVQFRIAKKRVHYQ